LTNLSSRINPTSADNKLELGGSKGVPKKVPLKDLSSDELTKYYDDYCLRHNIDKDTEEARRIWWSMFYKWKDGDEWIEYE